jgi:hypothetical protein
MLCGDGGRIACDGCAGSGSAAFEIVADEATRLWHRDLGRGVTHGTKALYVRFAVESYETGEIGGGR